MAKLTLRVDFDTEEALGPGKVALLELVDSLGSIAAAGRAMGMSYRRAWELVDSINQCFREPVVERGGRGRRDGVPGKRHPHDARSGLGIGGRGVGPILGRRD